MLIAKNILLTYGYKFNTFFRRSVIFGRLGVDISEAVLSSVLPHGSSWTDGLKLLTRFHSIVNESISALRYPTQCLQKFVLENHFANDFESNITMLATFKHLTAVKVAHKVIWKVVFMIFGN